jgi:hypothetical protein
MQDTIFASAAHAISGAASFAAKIWKKVRSIRPIKFLFVALVQAASAIVAFAAGALLLAALTAGFIATALSGSDEPETQPTQASIDSLPPSRQKYPQCDLAQWLHQERVLITPVLEDRVLEAMGKQFYCQQPTPTWQQWVIAQLQEQPEDTASWSYREAPLNNRLALELVCWEAFALVAEALKPIKANELKAIASDLSIKGYRRMTKSELLVALLC